MSRIFDERQCRNNKNYRIKIIMDFNEAKQKRFKILRNEYFRLLDVMRQTNWDGGYKVKCTDRSSYYSNRFIWLSKLECIKKAEEIKENALLIKNYHINKPWNKKQLEDRDIWRRLDFKLGRGEPVGGYSIEPIGNYERGVYPKKRKIVLHTKANDYTPNDAGYAEMEANQNSVW